MDKANAETLAAQVVELQQQIARDKVTHDLDLQGMMLEAAVKHVNKLKTALRSIAEGEFDDLDPDDGLHTKSARTVARNALKESNQSVP